MAHRRIAVSELRLLKRVVPGRGTLLTILVVANCSAAAGEMVNIPTRPSPPPGRLVLCPAALHTPFTLVGDRTKSPPVWGINLAGQPFAIVWPAGFRARFSPGLEILDPSGTVVARGGVVSDAGGAGDPTFGICGIGGKTY